MAKTASEKKLSELEEKIYKLVGEYNDLAKKSDFPYSILIELKENDGVDDWHNSNEWYSSSEACSF